MAASIVLKTRHSLIGKNLLPMLLELKNNTEPPDVFARLKKEHPIENYSMDELEAEFKKLTGESGKDGLMLAGKAFDLVEIRLLMHSAIVNANSIGAPKGSAVSLPEASLPGPSAAPVSKASTGSSVSISSSVTSVASGGDLESRIKTMEANFKDFQNKQSADKVEESLKNVRLLAGRPKLTSPSVLLASLEVLVQCATKSGHSDSEFYSKTLQACRQYEDHPEICTLCLKLLGTSEDRKISNTIAEWVKSKTYEQKSESTDESCKIVGSSHQQNLGHYFPYPPYPMNFGANNGFPNMGFGVQNSFPNMGLSPFNPMGTAGRPYVRSRLQKKRGVCYFCKDPGHFVNDCPKMKKE